MARRPPTCSIPPQLSGEATVGSTLNVSNGSWRNARGAVYSYAWRRDGAVIDRQVTHSYVVTDADAGHSLSAVVTCTNDKGAESAPSAPQDVPAGGTTPPPDVPPPSGDVDRTSTIVVDWKVNPKGSATKVYLDVGEDWNSFAKSDAGKDIGSGTSSVTGRAQVTGLTPNTPYYYRIRAVSANGSSIITDYGWMRTMPSSPGKTLTVGSGKQYTSIAAADAAASPGDEIVVSAGSYGVETFRTAHSGYVWIRAEAGATPIVAGFAYAGGQHIAYEGLKFDGHGMSGMPRIVQTANCQHLRFFDCDSAGDANMQGYDGGNCWAGPNSSDVHFWSHQAFGSAFGVKAYSGSSPAPTGYRFYGSDMTRSTYDIAHLDQFSDFAFERCLHRTPGTVTSEHHDAIQTTSGIRLRVRRCTFQWDGVKTSDGNDNGMINSDQGLTDMVFECNLIEKWRGSGVNLGNTKQSTVRNNTIVGCPGAGANADGQDLSGWGTDMSGTVVTNNISTKTWIGTARPTGHHNHNVSGSTNIGGVGDSSGSPGFVSGGYHPAAGSPTAHSGERAGLPWDIEGRGWGSKGQAKGAYAAADSDAPLVESMSLV